MTLQEFISKWTNKPCDWDGVYGTQCIDLYRFYCKEVLQVPQSPPVVGAETIWATYLTEYFDRIERTLEEFPHSGDILIWGGGSYGHVAICVDANKKDLHSFDANYPTGSLPHIQYHNYVNVLGWLRRKGGDNMAEIENLKLRITELEKDGELKMRVIQDREDELIQLKAKILDFQTTVVNLQNAQISLQDELGREKTEKVNLVVSLEAQVQRLEADSQTLAEEISIEKKENLRLQDKLDKWMDSYSGITLISLGFHKIAEEIKLVFRRR